MIAMGSKRTLLPLNCRRWRTCSLFIVIAVAVLLIWRPMYQSLGHRAETLIARYEDQGSVNSRLGLLKSHTVWLPVICHVEAKQVCDMWKTSTKNSPKKHPSLSNSYSMVKNSSITYQLLKSMHILDNPVELHQQNVLSFITRKVASQSSFRNNQPNSNDKVILIFQSIPGFPVHDINLFTVYSYIDSVVNYTQQIRANAQNGSKILVWLPPPIKIHSKLARQQPELLLVLHHLIINQLILKHSLVVAPVSVAQSVNGTSLSEPAELFLNTLNYQLRQLHHDRVSGSTAALKPLPPWNSVTQQLSDIARYLTERLEPRSGPFFTSLHYKCAKYVNSRKYDSICFPAIAESPPYKLLVTGLGGSGTHYVTSRLRNLGFLLGHERLKRDGSVVSFLFV